MANLRVPPDFKEFLKLLNAHGVEYLLVGGYAVAFHGYPRATADLDVWIARHPANAQRPVDALVEFGFSLPDLTPSLFMQEGRIVRMGNPPVRIEIATGISGVTFESCYGSRIVDTLDGVEVGVISIDDLKTNKRAAGRFRDLDDLENLP
ncbi:MAG: hypothetical protein AMXMBFR82_37250 [Candidatus Hydrogenedentota bacterium]